MNGIKISLFILSFLTLQIFAATTSYYAASRLINQTLDNYDKRIRPNYGGIPTEVAIDMYITNMEVNNDISNEMSMELSFYWRHIWIDPRLQFKFEKGIDEIQVGQDGSKMIWVPDTFCVNAKSGRLQDLTVPNSYIRIRSVGEVLFSARYHAEVRCSPDYHYFPFDVQICNFVFESYGYTSKEVNYRWTSGKSLGVSPDINLSLFKISSYKAVTENLNQDSTSGNYTRLVAQIVLERTGTTFYFYRVFLPLALLIFIGWSSLWINYSSDVPHFKPNNINYIPVFVTFVCLIGIISYSLAIHIKLLPEVNYCTTMDIYIVGSILFGLINFGITVLFLYYDSFCCTKLACVDVNSNNVTNNNNNETKDVEEKSEEKKACKGISKSTLHLFRGSLILFYIVCLLIYAVTAGP